MFSSKATTLAVSASLFAVASALTINTPSAGASIGSIVDNSDSLIQCQPTLLSWGDGVAPYYLAIIPGGQPSAAALENLPQQTGTSYTWLVDLASGQSVTVRVTDSTGAINYSDKVTIQPGTVTNCAAGASSAAVSSSAGGNVVVASSSSGRQPLTSSAAAPVSFSSSMATLITPTSVVVTSKPVSSGINNNAASASSSPAATSSKPNSAATLKAASGLLIGALIFALAA
ncbi:hypothetical protein EMMF5_002284 [Cystobasidiomycetes sp. EMM_F5]